MIIYQHTFLLIALPRVRRYLGNPADSILSFDKSVAWLLFLLFVLVCLLFSFQWGPFDKKICQSQNNFFPLCRMRTEMEVKWISVNIKYRLQYATECFAFHHFLFVRCASKKISTRMSTERAVWSFSFNERQKERNRATERTCIRVQCESLENFKSL